MQQRRGRGPFVTPRTSPLGLTSLIIYVADTGNHRICGLLAVTVTLSCRGAPREPVRASSTNPGAGRRPNGTLYVADTWNHRFRSLFDWQIPGEWAALPSVAGRPLRPNSANSGTARRGRWDAQGNVYVTDTGNSGSKNLRLPGLYSRKGGELSPARLRSRWGLDIDREGNVYVADTWNQRAKIRRQLQSVGPVDVAGWKESVINKAFAGQS